MRSDAMTAIGITTPTAILSYLFRPRETGPAEDAEGLLKVVGDGKEDDEDLDELLKVVGDGKEDDEDFDELLNVVGDGEEDDEEGDGSKGSAGDVIEDIEVPVETLDD